MVIYVFVPPSFILSPSFSLIASQHGCEHPTLRFSEFRRRPLLLSEPPAETRALRRLLAELSFEAAEAPEATRDEDCTVCSKRTIYFCYLLFTFV